MYTARRAGIALAMSGSVDTIIQGIGTIKCPPTCIHDPVANTPIAVANRINIRTAGSRHRRHPIAIATTSVRPR